MGNERFCHGAAGDDMQHRRLDLKKTTVIEKFADCGDHFIARTQSPARLGRGDQILFAVAETRLDILEAVEFFRRRLERLGKHRYIRRIHRDLAARRSAHDTGDADDIAEVE